tara:strand:+ start:221 stop:406 length:186 start_codon:yes stop_codon:yes gene_type:complete
MTNEEVKDIIGIREYVIAEFKKLKAGSNPTTAMMKQVDVASVYTKVIENLDYMLNEYVSFK